MTRQEMFDIVIPALRKQGARSMREDDSKCAYRGVEGRKCAVGHLIPDEIYTPAMEGDLYAISARDLIQKFPELGFKKEDSEFLTELQRLHDAHYNWHDDGTLKESAVQDIALRYGLTVPA